MHYVIGDVQGCYRELSTLLHDISYNRKKDHLWFCGDLVNRGPQSLAVLKFISDLPRTIIVLGNHDLHLLRLIEGLQKPEPNDSLQEILASNEVKFFGKWLRHHPFMHFDPDFNMAMVHAGVASAWDLSTALSCAQEVAQVLQGSGYRDFLQNLFGDEPSVWSPTLQGQDRLRFITNCFTRIRFCDDQGRLYLNYKGEIGSQPPHLVPWFEVPKRKTADLPIVFGHWSALVGKIHQPNLYALDTGCVWGGSLTALCLETKKRYHTPCVPYAKF